MKQRAKIAGVTLLVVLGLVFYLGVFPGAITSCAFQYDGAGEILRDVDGAGLMDCVPFLISVTGFHEASEWIALLIGGVILYSVGWWIFERGQNVGRWLRRSPGA